MGTVLARKLSPQAIFNAAGSSAERARLVKGNYRTGRAQAFLFYFRDVALEFCPWGWVIRCFDATVVGEDGERHAQLDVCVVYLGPARSWRGDEVSSSQSRGPGWPSDFSR